MQTRLVYLEIYRDVPALNFFHEVKSEVLRFLLTEMRIVRKKWTVSEAETRAPSIIPLPFSDVW